jgi:hypothetical protein
MCSVDVLKLADISMLLGCYIIEIQFYLYFSFSFSVCEVRDNGWCLQVKMMTSLAMKASIPDRPKLLTVLA